MIKITKNKEQVEINVRGTPNELIADLIAIGVTLADACNGNEEVTDEFKSAFEFGIEKGKEAKGKEIYGNKDKQLAA